MDFVELLKRGTSGLSKARVENDNAASVADVRACTEDSRTYVRDACRTPTGTNAAAKLFHAAKKVTVMRRALGTS